MSATQASRVFGISRQSFSKWGAPSSMGPAGRPVYCLREVVEWRREMDRLAAGVGVDGEVTSKALERYRVAQATIRELDLAEREATLIPREVMRDAWGMAAVVLRRAAEHLQRTFGAEAHAVLEDALDEIEAMALVGRD